VEITMALTLPRELDEKIEELKNRYPTTRACLIPALVLANKHYGYISRDVMDAVAQRLGLPKSHVINTATFYTLLHKEPVGKFHIQVCVNVSCFLKGSDRLLEHLKKKLGIAPGEMTSDGLFSLECVQCLASCGTAPTIQINDDYYEAMTVEKLDKLLDELRTGGKK
jgi:NADH-quinone oxidoreductase E subunit